MVINVTTWEIGENPKFFTQEVTETPKFFKPVDPNTAPLGTQQFRKTDEYSVKKINAKSVMIFGRDMEEMVKAYCQFALPEKVMQKLIEMQAPGSSTEVNQPTEEVEEIDPFSTEELQEMDSEEQATSDEVINTSVSVETTDEVNVVDELDDEFLDSVFCESCHKAMAIDDPVVVVNENTKEERYECSECYEKHLAGGSEISCPACDAVFDAKNIVDNRCPSCNAFIPPKLAKHFQPETFPPEGDILIHTDGCCLTNPGTGGWAAVIQCGEKTIEISDGKFETTNQVMELTAVSKALAKLDELGVDKTRNVKIVSDSKYVVNGLYGSNGMDAWYINWRKNNWHASAGPVKNLEHWKEAISLYESRKPFVKLVWTKGHAGNPMNERCDRLAAIAANKLMQMIQD